MGRVWFVLLLAGMTSGAWNAGAAPPIEAYGIPAMDMVTLSPSGDRYAYVEPDGDKHRLIVATIDNKPLLAQSLGTTKVRGVEWADGDHIMITSSSTAELPFEFFEPKQELSAVIVFDLVHRKMVQVFGRAHENRVLNTVVGFYGTAQVDGHLYGYFAGFSGGQVDLYRVDLDTGEIHIASPSREYLDNWVLDAKGEVVARSFYNSTEGSWWVESAGDGGKTLASGHFDFGGVRNIYPGRTSDTILAELPIAPSGDQPKGYVFQELSLSGAPIKDPVDTTLMTRPIFDRLSSLWIGLTTSNENKSAEMISAALEARWSGTAKAFPGYIVHLISHSADLNRMIVYTDGGDDSGTYWIVDTAARSADQLGRAHPLVKAADVGPVSEVEWRAADGLPISGIITLPPGKPARALPLVVLPHGGPEERTYRRFDWWAQVFAARGYAVFQPNYRGSGDFDVGFRNAGLGQWGRKMQTDISDGVAELARQGTVDPRRVCIVGDNYGGYAALAGVTVQQGVYRCAVSVAGVADPEAMLDRIRTGVRGTSSSLRYWKAYMGAGSTYASNNLDAISPVALASRADAPILLIHGQDDTVVPISQSKSMEQALKRAGKPVEFVVMENEDHWLSRGETRTEMLKSAVGFVEKYNPAD